MNTRVNTDTNTASRSTATVSIAYCTQCRWLLRAAWMAQELLITFEDELTEVSLRPATGGMFEVRLNDRLLWSRKAEGRFPELREIKQRIRDEIDPERTLGHSDRPVNPAPTS